MQHYAVLSMPEHQNACKIRGGDGYATNADQKDRAHTGLWSAGVPWDIPGEGGREQKFHLS